MFLIGSGRNGVRPFLRPVMCGDAYDAVFVFFNEEEY
jgi:hypothetical protein